MTTRAEIISRLRGFIEETFLYMRPDFELGEDDSLMGKGIVDSMGVMEVIAFIDEELGVTVADADVTEQNLGTLNAIAFFAITLFMAWYATRQATAPTTTTDLGVMSQVPAAPATVPGAPQPATAVPAAPQPSAQEPAAGVVPAAPQAQDADAQDAGPAAQTEQ